ncbi:MAG: hypothetical protein NC429_01340 [Lachnospiraceae bacterium]|nr:hypothetical protein [Lachnospiraceae bacterium]
MYQKDIQTYLDELGNKNAKIERTLSRLKKKGDVYLIDNQSDIDMIGNLIKRGEEIEPGLPASEASYRLHRSFRVSDWFQFGTDKEPFKGTFDGDGHDLWGKFASEAESGAECFMHLDPSAVVVNLSVQNDMFSYDKINVQISDVEESENLIQNLNAFSGHPFSLTLETDCNDMSELVACLKEYWDKSEKRNGHFWEIEFYPYSQAPEKTDFLLDFVSLFGKEAEQIISKELKAEKSSGSSTDEVNNPRMLSFLRAEQTEDLCIFTFAVKGLEEEEYHLIIQGTWEGKEIDFQHLVIPATGCSSGFFSYHIESQDINCDGFKDLLIHEGGSGGSGGSWNNYRGVIWEGKEFRWYSSFPAQLNFVEFYRNRLIARGQYGSCEQWIKVYEIVDGKYVLSKELDYLLRTNDADSLYYYEMGNLIKIHTITGGYEEVKGLYPDLCYWAE